MRTPAAVDCIIPVEARSVLSFRPRDPTVNLLRAVFFGAVLALSACASAGSRSYAREGSPEATSLLGTPLYSPLLPDEAALRLEKELEQARTDYQRNPADPEAILWLGRRTAYLGRYREAIEIFSQGIKRYPNDPRMYRHRGHRYITIREFSRAERDLERATRLIRGMPDQPEPDGAASTSGTPSSTLHGNVWYHLGLVRYLQGDFDGALLAYQEALRLAGTAETRLATSDWIYTTLRRLRRTADAERVLASVGTVSTDGGNSAYQRRLLLYRGAITPDSLMRTGAESPVEAITHRVGVANWHLLNGDRASAERILWDVVATENWAAFAYIAAEAELARIQRRRRR